VLANHLCSIRLIHNFRLIIKDMYNCRFNFLDTIFVTGFAKTFHVRTRIEIHFIAYCNSHTRALSRHNNKTGIDKQFCFYRRPVFDPVKSRRTIIDPVRLLRGINKVHSLGSNSVPLNVCTTRGMVRATVAICLAHCAHNLVACVWEHR